MPCRISHEEEQWYERDGNRKKFGREILTSELTMEIACELAALVEKNKLMKHVSRPAWKWWEDHKKRDRELAEVRENEERKKKLAKAARAKLTPEEYDAIRQQAP